MSSAERRPVTPLFAPLSSGGWRGVAAEAAWLVAGMSALLLLPLHGWSAAGAWVCVAVNTLMLAMELGGNLYLLPCRLRTREAQRLTAEATRGAAESVRQLRQLQAEYRARQAQLAREDAER